MTEVLEARGEEIATLFNSAFSGSLKVDESDVEDMAVTRDTIEQFVANRAEWAERGSVKVQTPTALFVANAQVRKGQERKDIFIVDLGDVRIVHDRKPF